MTEPNERVLARAFVGVSYLIGCRGGELLAREPLNPAGARLGEALSASERGVRSRALAQALLPVGQDLDRRRVG